MQKISEMNKYKKKDLTLTLRKSFMLALKDEKFVKLVNRLDVDEETLIKYTTKLENTVSELNNCSGCKGISHCKNRVTGYVSYPGKQNNGLVFSYIPCKYQKELSKIKNTVTFFETSCVKVPFFPLTVTTKPLTSTVTPAGTAIGILPIRDMPAPP